MDYQIKITDNTNDGETDTTGFMYKFEIYAHEEHYDEVGERVRTWCSENFSTHEYFFESSKWKRIIYVYTHTYESSMAFKLTWG